MSIISRFVARLQSRRNAPIGTSLLLPISLQATSTESTFGVAKILAMDPEGIHVRLYRERLEANGGYFGPDSL